MPQTPIAYTLTKITQEEAIAIGGAIPKLVSPLFEEHRYRYKCGHCGTELTRRIEPIAVKGVIFGCPDCQKFSRFDG